MDSMEKRPYDVHRTTKKQIPTKIERDRRTQKSLINLKAIAKRTARWQWDIQGFRQLVYMTRETSSDRKY